MIKISVLVIDWSVCVKEDCVNFESCLCLVSSQLLKFIRWLEEAEESSEEDERKPSRV